MLFAVVVVPATETRAEVGAPAPDRIQVEHLRRVVATSAVRAAVITAGDARTPTAAMGTALLEVPMACRPLPALPAPGWLAATGAGAPAFDACVLCAPAVTGSAATLLDERVFVPVPFTVTGAATPLPDACPF
ncbi:MAG: hypothetical protein NVS2B16_23810 [Chloroflexota bacterium]